MFLLQVSTILTQPLSNSSDLGQNRTPSQLTGAPSTLLRILETYHVGSSPVFERALVIWQSKNLTRCQTPRLARQPRGARLVSTRVKRPEYGGAITNFHTVAIARPAFLRFQLSTIFPIPRTRVSPRACCHSLPSLPHRSILPIRALKPER